MAKQSVSTIGFSVLKGWGSTFPRASDCGWSSLWEWKCWGRILKIGLWTYDQTSQGTIPTSPRNSKTDLYETQRYNFHQGCRVLWVFYYLRSLFLWLSTSSAYTCYSISKSVNTPISPLRYSPITWSRPFFKMWKPSNGCQWSAWTNKVRWRIYGYDPREGRIQKKQQSLQITKRK